LFIRLVGLSISLSHKYGAARGNLPPAVALDPYVSNEKIPRSGLPANSARLAIVAQHQCHVTVDAHIQLSELERAEVVDLHHLEPALTIHAALSTGCVDVVVRKHLIERRQVVSSDSLHPLVVQVRKLLKHSVHFVLRSHT